MLKLGLVLLLVSFHDTTADVTDGTELVMSFLVHRHGDRTPMKPTLMFSDNSDALAKLVNPYGYEQLTEAGKQRAYELGKYIGTRYSELLGPKYNYSELYIRSTNFSRTKTTITTAISAIYPPNCSDLNREPILYNTKPIKYDFNLSILNCPTLMAAIKSFISSPFESLSSTYSNALNVLSNKVDLNITQLPSFVYPIYDLYISQISLGLPLDPAIEAIWDEIAEAADATTDLIFGSEDYIALEAGVLLNQFYKYSAKVIAGEDTQRVRIYSAHDFNVYAFETVTQITPRQGVPKFASAYSLEVRKVTATGKYVVLPVYLPEPGQKEIYLTVKGCDLLCDYDQFVEITKKYSLDINSWRTQCNYTDGTVVNDSVTL